MQLALGAFLIVHGLIHLAWVTPKPDDPSYPFTLERSAVLPTASPASLRPMGAVLVALVTLLFLLAGLGVLGVPGLVTYWRLATVVGAMLSVLLIGVFWHPWFVLGLLLDIALVGLVLGGWGPFA